MTTVQLARIVGVGQSTISRVERMEQGATADLAERLAQCLGITEIEILYPERFVSGTRQGSEA